MPATYEPIATTTLATTTTSITFSSISAAYTDLILILTARWSGIGTSSSITIRINGDTGTNYSQLRLYGDGSTINTDRQNNIDYLQIALNNIDNTTPTLSTVNFLNYSGSTYKTILSAEAADLNGSGLSSRFCGAWRNTAAINSILINAVSSWSFRTGTTATLYGILKA
jgi:hypothetical protein